MTDNDTSKEQREYFTTFPKIGDSFDSPDGYDLVCATPFEGSETVGYGTRVVSCNRVMCLWKRKSGM